MTESRYGIATRIVSLRRLPIRFLRCRGPAGWQALRASLLGGESDGQWPEATGRAR